MNIEYSWTSGFWNCFQHNMIKRNDKLKSVGYT